MTAPLPHCRAAASCASIKPGRHCRPCAQYRVANDPAIRARRVAGLRRSFADEDAEIARRHAISLACRGRPATAAQRASRERHGPDRARRGILRPDVQALSHGPEARAKAARKFVERRLGWCPLEYRDEYRCLCRSQRMRAADARTLIEQQIEADRARWAASGRLQRSQQGASHHG